MTREQVFYDRKTFEKAVSEAKASNTYVRHSERMVKVSKPSFNRPRYQFKLVTA